MIQTRPVLRCCTRSKYDRSRVLMAELMDTPSARQLQERPRGLPGGRKGRGTLRPGLRFQHVSVASSVAEQEHCPQWTSCVFRYVRQTTPWMPFWQRFGL